MKETNLLYAMENIDARYIQEAEDYRHPGYRRVWVAAGILLCLVVGYLFRPAVISGDNTPDLQPEKLETEEQAPVPAPEKEMLYISMADIPFHDLADTGMDAMRRYLDVAWRKTWTYDQVLDYYTPALGSVYVPEGLKPMQSEGGSWTYFQMPDGAIVDDTVGFGWFHDYYADGSPKLTEDVAAVYGFTLTASRTGIFHCYLLHSPDDPMETCTIDGVEVTFGYRKMPYGPYDPDTHTPSGYYDCYTAAFKMDGAEYEIVTEQLSGIEIVRIAASIISPDKIVIIE